MPVADVAKLVAETTEFKTNCNLVIIDFLIRWGAVGRQHSGGGEVALRLHSLVLGGTALDREGGSGEPTRPSRMDIILDQITLCF